MIKRIAQALVLLCFVIILATPALADGIKRQFSDLPDTHWAAGNIYNLVSRNWLSGYPDNTFRPDEKVTRAELAAMVARAVGKNPPLPDSPTFSDVPGNEWFFSPVEASKAFFISDPFLKDGLFRPQDLATRQEAASAIAIASGLDVSDQGKLQAAFSDYSSILPGYRGILASAIEKGIIKGYPDGTFGPLAPLTRAEAAVIIGNAFLKENQNSAAPDIEKILNSIDLTKNFSDIPEEYKAIRDRLEKGDGNIDGVSLEYFIDEISPGKIEGDKTVIVFARVDPFKYFTFSDVTFSSDPERTKVQAEKIASEASGDVPGKTVLAVIGYTNLSFNLKTPETFGREYTSYSPGEDGWRVKRFYAAAMAKDGKAIGFWLAQRQ